LNTVVSAGYYLKVLRVMILEAPGDQNVKPIRSGPVLFVMGLAGLTLLAGLFWDPLAHAANQAVDSLRPVSTTHG